MFPQEGGFLSPVLGMTGCALSSAGDGSESCVHLPTLLSGPSAKAPRAPSTPSEPDTASSHELQSSCHLFTARGLSLGQQQQQGYPSLLSARSHLPSSGHTLISSGNHD